MKKGATFPLRFPSLFAIVVVKRKQPSAHYREANMTVVVGIISFIAGAWFGIMLIAILSAGRK